MYILRTKFNKSEEDIEEIIFNDDYDGLKKIIDVEKIAHLACEAIEIYIIKTGTIELDRLKELIINSNVEVIFDDNGKIVGIYKYKEEIE